MLEKQSKMIQVKVEMITGVRSETGWGSKVKTSAVIRVWSFDEQQQLV